MKRHISISDEEYNDVLLWLGEEKNIRTESLSQNEIIKMRDTISFQRWRLRKAYREFATAMRETRLGSFIISAIEFLDECFDKIF